MSKIKKDDHSIYVRTNGSVFRPVPSIWSYPNPMAIDPKDPYRRGMVRTKFSEGNQVKVSHVSGTIFCRVKTKGHEEYWHSHGSYLDSYDLVKKTCPFIDSDKIWKPKQD